MLIKRNATVKELLVEEEEQKPLEHKGVTYNKGDFISIKGEQKKMIYDSWSVSPKNGKTIVHCWMEQHKGINYHWRSFYVERIKGKRKPKPGSLCPDHPTYQAKRRPRSGCERCQIAYEHRTQAAEEKATRNVGKTTKAVKKIGSLTIKKVGGSLE